MITLYTMLVHMILGDSIRSGRSRDTVAGESITTSLDGNLRPVKIYRKAKCIFLSG